MSHHHGSKRVQKLLETNSSSIIDSSASNYVRYPESGSQKINVVEQEPLFIKLVPIQTEREIFKARWMYQNKDSEFNEFYVSKFLNNL